MSSPPTGEEVTERKGALLVENVVEAATACLVAMVQGNLLALTLTHWLIASRTGILAGSLAALVAVVARLRSARTVSLALGVVTGVVDYWVHPGNFGGAATEAVVTGLAAAGLSYGVARLRRSAGRLRRLPASGDAD